MCARAHAIHNSPRHWRVIIIRAVFGGRGWDGEYFAFGVYRLRAYNGHQGNAQHSTARPVTDTTSATTRSHAHEPNKKKKKTQHQNKHCDKFDARRNSHIVHHRADSVCVCVCKTISQLIYGQRLIAHCAERLPVCQSTVPPNLKSGHIHTNRWTLLGWAR